MTKANRALAFLVIAAMGLWGCTKGSSNGSSSLERIKTLEARCAKLEEELKVVPSLRKKLAAVEEQQQAAARERDEVRQQLNLRTQERDQAIAQFETFRKGIRELLGQADLAATGATVQPASKELPAAGKF